MSPRSHVTLTLPLVLTALASFAHAELKYTKREVKIPMRDGVQLFTAIYEPVGATEPLPILLCRTPYSVAPYGDGKLKDTIGPSELLEQSGFVVAYQDVRGCYLSEGQFVDVRPHVPHAPAYAVHQLPLHRPSDALAAFAGAEEGQDDLPLQIRRHAGPKRPGRSRCRRRGCEEVWNGWPPPRTVIAGRGHALTRSARRGPCA